MFATGYCGFHVPAGFWELLAVWVLSYTGMFRLARTARRGFVVFGGPWGGC